MIIRSHFAGDASEQVIFKKQFPKDGVRRVIIYSIDSHDKTLIRHRAIMVNIHVGHRF